MRVPRDETKQPAHPAGRKAPEPSAATWSVVAIAGSAAAVYAAVGSLESVVIAVAGIVALAFAQHRLGFLEARRAGDPRVAELIRERDHWRGIAEYVGRLAQQPVAGPPPGPRRADDAPAPAAARPSEKVRGGGRPGAVGSARVDPLDAPLPGEAPGVSA